MVKHYAVTEPRGGYGLQVRFTADARSHNGRGGHAPDRQMLARCYEMNLLMMRMLQAL
jgi:hypothetical protein